MTLDWRDRNTECSPLRRAADSPATARDSGDHGKGCCRACVCGAFACGSSARHRSSLALGIAFCGLCFLSFICLPAELFAQRQREPRALAINPHWLSFSSYLGPVVNLTYDDTAVLHVARILRIGALRYPGGETANHWDMKTGSWTGGVRPEYAARLEGHPTGTWTPAAYMQGVGARLSGSPIWNLNLVSADDPPAQLDLLKAMRVPVEMVEIGNEDAIKFVNSSFCMHEWSQGVCHGDGCLRNASCRHMSDFPAYLARATAISLRTEELFPKARLSVIGCHGLNWSNCAPRLFAAREGHVGKRALFDAVSIHLYGPDNRTITLAADEELMRAATLAWPWRELHAMEKRVSTDLGADVSIWLDEFNWGGDWSGATTWPGERHGALRGMLWVAYVLTAISATESAVAEGRAGFEVLAFYALFRQEGARWSHWASCVKVSERADKPEEIEFDGVSQLVAHMNFVVFGLGHAEVTPARLSTEELSAEAALGDSLPCVLAARFDGNSSHSTWVALNVCPHRVQITPIAARAIDSYEAHDNGGWVHADNIASLETPPWQGGPLRVKTSRWTSAEEAPLLTSLASLSLNFVTVSPATPTRND